MLKLKVYRGGTTIIYSYEALEDFYHDLAQLKEMGFRVEVVE